MWTGTFARSVQSRRRGFSSPPKGLPVHCPIFFFFLQQTSKSQCVSGMMRLLYFSCADGQVTALFLGYDVQGCWSTMLR